jgi:hypothetical protein
MFAGQRMVQRGALAHAFKSQELHPCESVKIRGLELCGLKT